MESSMNRSFKITDISKDYCDINWSYRGFESTPLDYFDFLMSKVYVVFYIKLLRALFV